MDSIQFIVDAGNYFEYANDCLGRIVDVSLYDMMFEADSDTTQKNNTNLGKSAIEAIKKGIAKLIDAVKTMIESIKTFVQVQFLSANEKERYKQLKTMIKNDPELSKKVVTIADFREYEKLYDEAMKKLEEDAKKDTFTNEVVENIMSTLNEKLGDIGNKVKGMGQRAIVKTTLDSAVDIADSNVILAKTMNYALEKELVELKAVEDALGEKEVDKAIKKIEKYSRNSLLHRAKVMILRRKHRTLQSIIKKNTSKLLSYTNVKVTKDGVKVKGDQIMTNASITKGVIKNPSLSKSIMGKDKDERKENIGTVRTITKNTKEVNKEMKYTKKKIDKSKKKTDKELKDLKKFVGL